MSAETNLRPHSEAVIREALKAYSVLRQGEKVAFPEEVLNVITVIGEGLASPDDNIFILCSHALIENAVWSSETGKETLKFGNEIAKKAIDVIASKRKVLIERLKIAGSFFQEKERRNLNLLNLILRKPLPSVIRNEVIDETKKALPKLVDGMLRGEANCGSLIASYLSYRPEQGQRILRLSRNKFETLDAKQLAPYLSPFFTDGDSRALRETGYNLLRLVLLKSGLTPNEVEKLYVIWEKEFIKTDSGHDNLYGRTLAGDTVDTICRIEQQERGLAARLFRDHGVWFFGRYPDSLLLKQSERRFDRNIPYGVIIFPRSDRDMSFFNDRVCLMDFIETIGDRFNLKLVECGSVTEMCTKLSSLAHLYGKASFAILGGHGNPYGIALGDDWHDGRVSISLLQKQGGIFQAYFKPGSTMILFSCSTGKKDGIAQVLSRENLEVLAPDRDSFPVRIYVDFRTKKPVFEVLYGAEAKCCRFKNGEMVK